MDLRGLMEGTGKSGFSGAIRIGNPRQG